VEALLMESFGELESRLSERHIPAMAWGKVFYEYDPGMYKAYVEWTTRARQHVELEPKIREMVAIVVNCVVAWPSPYADVHFHRALEEGAHGGAARVHAWIQPAGEGPRRPRARRATFAAQSKRPAEGRGG
jgi:hypothetical protein